MKNFYLLPVISFSLLSCGSSENKDSENEKVASQQKVIEKETPFSVKTTSSFDIAKLEKEGTILYSKIWEDTNGENIAMFTQVPDKQLFVYHYAIKDNAPKLLRKVTDFIKDCEFDYGFEFIQSSIAVTDLDKNNLGEVTFAYKITCTSDVSPWDMKLLTLENGNKYIIRGTTALSFENETYGGDKTIGESFVNGPKSFLENANKIWDASIKELKWRCDKIY